MARRGDPAYEFGWGSRGRSSLPAAGTGAGAVRRTKSMTIAHLWPRDDHCSPGRSLFKCGCSSSRATYDSDSHYHPLSPSSWTSGALSPAVSGWFQNRGGHSQCSSAMTVYWHAIQASRNASSGSMLVAVGWSLRCGMQPLQRCRPRPSRCPCPCLANTRLRATCVTHPALRVLPACRRAVAHSDFKVRHAQFAPHALQSSLLSPASGVNVARSAGRSSSANNCHGRWSSSGSDRRATSSFASR